MAVRPVPPRQQTQASSFLVYSSFTCGVSGKKNQTKPKTDFCHHSWDHRLSFITSWHAVLVKAMSKLSYLYMWSAMEWLQPRHPHRKLQHLFFHCVCFEMPSLGNRIQLFRTEVSDTISSTNSDHISHHGPSVSNLYMLVHLWGRHFANDFRPNYSFNFQGMVENLLTKGGFFDQTPSPGQGWRKGLGLTSFTVFIGTYWSTKLLKTCHSTVLFQSKE